MATTILHRPDVAAEEPVALGQVVRFAAAATSLGAATVHASSIAEHTFHVLHAAAFVGMATFQASWAYLVLRSTERRVLLAGAVGHGSIVLLWLLSRVSGLPDWLPGPGGREAAGLKDLAATTLGVVALVAVDVLSRRDVAARAIRASRAGAVAATVAVAALVLAAAGSFAVGHEHGRTGLHAEAPHGH